LGAFKLDRHCTVFMAATSVISVSSSSSDDGAAGPIPAVASSTLPEFFTPQHPDEIDLTFLSQIQLQELVVFPAFAYLDTDTCTEKLGVLRNFARDADPQLYEIETNNKAYRAINALRARLLLLYRGQDRCQDSSRSVVVVSNSQPAAAGTTATSWTAAASAIAHRGSAVNMELLQMHTNHLAHAYDCTACLLLQETQQQQQQRQRRRRRRQELVEAAATAATLQETLMPQHPHEIDLSSLSADALEALAVSNATYSRFNTEECLAKMGCWRGFVQGRPHVEIQKAYRAINALRARLLLLDRRQDMQLLQQQGRQVDAGTSELSC
jgi:hypothetical protein